MVFILFSLMSLVNSVEYTVSDEWTFIEYEVSSSDAGQDLRIQVQKDSGTPPLLLLVRYQERPAFQFRNSRNSWYRVSNYQDMEGWQQNKDSLFVTIPAQELQPGDSWHIGIYNEEETQVTFDYFATSVDRDTCASPCQVLGKCNKGECQCQLSTIIGPLCQVQTHILYLENTYYFSLDAQEWGNYYFNIDTGKEALTFKSNLINGDPHFFIQKDNSDQKKLPTMFDADIFLLFQNDNEFEHDIDIGSQSRWYLGLYCYGNSQCRLNLEMEYKDLGDSQDFLWLIIFLIIILSLICFLVPIAIKGILKYRNRNRNATSPDPNEQVFTSDQMESHFPAVKMKNFYKSDSDPCTICFDEFGDDSLIRKLRCNHYFHLECIDTWAKNKSSCPLCKNNFLNTPQQATRLHDQPMDVQDLE